MILQARQRETDSSRLAHGDRTPSSVADAIEGAQQM
jgi:hypothetical protein